MRTKLTILYSAISILTLAEPRGAFAEDETFRVTSMAEKDVQIEFFSEDRHHVWPGNDKAYNLNDYKEHGFKLACVNNEKICYGAWVTNKPNVYWGMGFNGKEGCADCCVGCSGGHTRDIILRDPIRR
jgi:hypothetical protein